MSNKQARRASKAPVASSSAPARGAAAPPSSLRLRVSSSVMIGGGLLAAVGALLPWLRLPDGSDQAGIASVAGIGVLVLGLVVAAIGVFIRLRPDHPSARTAAWAGLAAAMGIGGLGVIAVLTLDKSTGVAMALGVLVAIAGGMVATMGIRGLLERR